METQATGFRQMEGNSSSSSAIQDEVPQERMGAETNPTQVMIGAGIFAAVTLTMCFLTHIVLGAMALICIVAQLVGIQLGRWVLSQGEGSPKFRQVGDDIRTGSEAYVKTMFGTIFKLALPGTVVMFVLSLMYNMQKDRFDKAFMKALMVTLSFIFGALCSSIAGIIGMWSSTRANGRVAHASVHSRSLRYTIVVALRSGAVAGITVVSMAVFGICFLFAFAHLLVEKDTSKVPVLLVGYGFGASFVAMFAQLGGGIFTKAADVGADLCGKIEGGIDEDDMRNPGVLADLVGDNVGDCCARGADLFESLSAEIIAAMILCGSLHASAGLELGTTINYILFPLVVHVCDLFVSFIGVMAVRSSGSEVTDPMVPLKQGYKVAVGLAAVCFFVITRLMLNTSVAPHAWIYYFLCGIVGMVTGLLIVYITQYYTDFNHQPVKDIARASESGHGPNIIAGLGVGFESTFLPVLLIVVAILTSYFLGSASGIKSNVAGLVGTAVATMGMLSNLTYVLAMDVFGPIADNAAGIVEFGEGDEDARNIMDRLDAVGNTTKAFTKGFAVGSAGLACFLLFRAFLDVVYEFSCIDIKIDIVQPEVFSGGIIGSATVFLFASMAMHAVGDTAQKVVENVREQWRDGEVMAYRRKPDYFACVEIVSKAAISKMIKPGALVLCMPVLVGGVFRLLGDFTNDNILGAKCMTSYLVCSSMTAMLVALFLNNGGGAWDNAKKYIESGHHGGKRSEAHKAAVTGDTVGDPAKDTAGPSLHVLMKLTATVTMVIGPLVAVPTVSCKPAELYRV